MKHVKMKAKGNYRGKKYMPDTILPMSEDLANKLILSGKGSFSTKEAYETQEANPYSKMILAELKEVEYKKLNRDPLIKYANACGLKIAEETKDEIYALLQDVDFKVNK